MKSIRKSVWALVLGLLLALIVGLLVVFGVLAPLFTMFQSGGRFGLEITGSTALPTVLLVFAAGFAFYWGGMLASYKAPARRRLHGTLVSLVAFTVSPVINLLGGKGPFPNIDTIRAVVFLLVTLVVSVATSYVGARRGEAIYAHNQYHLQRRKRRNQTTAG